MRNLARLTRRLGMTFILAALFVSLVPLVAGAGENHGTDHPVCEGRIEIPVEALTYTVGDSTDVEGPFQVWSKAGNNDHKDQGVLAEGTMIRSREFNDNEQEKEISHVDLCPQESEPDPENCDTSAVKGDVASWLSTNGFDGGDCFAIDFDAVCGTATGSVTKQVEPQYPPGPFKLVWNEGDSIDLPNAQNFPAEFGEDYNGGSVNIVYYIVGPEGDWLAGDELPNFWTNNPGSKLIDTDCVPSTTPTITVPEETTTTQPEETTTTVAVVSGDTSTTVGPSTTVDPTAETLPFTGPSNDTSLWLLVGAALLALGGVLVLTTRSDQVS